jgi:hypothetical protein
LQVIIEHIAIHGRPQPVPDIHLLCGLPLLLFSCRFTPKDPSVPTAYNLSFFLYMVQPPHSQVMDILLYAEYDKITSSAEQVTVAVTL